MDSQTAMTFAFDRGEVMGRAAANSEAFKTADPYAHVVIDGLLRPEVLDAVLDEFPEPEQATWQQFQKQTEVKLALADTTQMGPATRNLLAEFNGQVFIRFLEELTSIEALLPDPHLAGGGLHQIRTGGFLKVHADFNRHDGLRLDRRLNALIYLNRDWDESYGGALELWDREMHAPVKRVLPIFNRMVVFATTSTSYHGHPEPLTCPPDRARRSMALYYYTNGRPAEEQAAPHSTLFQHRPGERFQTSKRDALRRWIPPAITDRRRAQKS